jgi:NADH-quinone oxidoreductase subunit M
MEGAIYQMLNHGVSTGGLFLLIGMIYLRRHTREISEFGGLWRSIPIFAAVFMVVMLSSIGLPGLNGFVGEFLVLLGTYLSKSLAAEIAVVGLILGALYMLYAYERVMFGPITKAVNQTIADLSAREIAVMAPLVVLMLLMGLYPRPLLSRMEPSVGALLGRVHAAQARIDRRQHDARVLAAPLDPASVASSK